MPNVSPQVLVNKITFKLDDELHTRLTRQSAIDGTPVSATIRALLATALEQERTKRGKDA